MLRDTVQWVAAAGRLDQVTAEALPTPTPPRRYLGAGTARWRPPCGPHFPPLFSACAQRPAALLAPALHGSDLTSPLPPCCPATGDVSGGPRPHWRGGRAGRRRARGDRRRMSAPLRRVQQAPRHLLVCEKGHARHPRSRHAAHVRDHAYNCRVSAGGEPLAAVGRAAGAEGAGARCPCAGGHRRDTEFSKEPRLLQAPRDINFLFPVIKHAV